MATVKSSIPLDSLPALVLSRLMLFCGRATLRSLRLANKTISHEATIRYFYNTYLGPVPESARSFKSLLERPWIKRCIRQVFLQTYNEAKGRHVEDDDETSDETDEAWLALRELPNLVGLGLIFAKHCAIDDDRAMYWGEPPSSYEYRTACLQMLVDLYESLDSKASIRSLSLHHLQNINDPAVTGREEFKQLVSGLKELSLFVISEKDDAAPEMEIGHRQIHDFVREMPSTWLTSTNLTTLVLYFDFMVGMFPVLDWRKTSFPNLKLLALGRHSFSRRWQLDWLVSHSSLEELYLDNCIIVYEWQTTCVLDGEGYPLELKRTLGTQGGEETVESYYYTDRWHDYFDRIADKLHLQEFRFGRGNWSGTRIFDALRSIDRDYNPLYYRSPYATFEESEGQGGISHTCWTNGDWARDDGRSNDESTDDKTRLETACYEQDIKAYERLFAKFGLPALGPSAYASSVTSDKDWDDDDTEELWDDAFGRL